MAYIVGACIVIANIAMAYSHGQYSYGLHYYGPYSYDLCSYGSYLCEHSHILTFSFLPVQSLPV